MQRTLSGRANGRHEGAPAAEAAWIAGSGELGRRLSMAISERMSERDERLAPLALYEQMSARLSCPSLPLPALASTRKDTAKLRLRNY